MKKMTFKVNTKNENNVVSLIKEINNIVCRIQVDLENNVVLVEDVDDTIIDSVIELVDKYYIISSVDIDNIFEDNMLLNDTQNEDESIPKVEFKNEYIEDLINRFIKTAYWAMYKMKVPEKEIGDFIWTSINEVSMRYNQKKNINFSIGDIVDCNYGTHLMGEINGNHIPAIVCNITSNGNMAYLVPIIKGKEYTISNAYLELNIPEDAINTSGYCTSGTVLLDKGRYLRAERFHEVIGKTKPQFFSKLLRQLVKTFNFTDYMSKDNVKTSNDGAKKIVKKVGEEEAALLKEIGDYLNKLDSNKKVEEQIESFLTEIGMTTTEKMVTQSFMIACNIKKINYENIVFELQKIFPESKEDIIKYVLKNNFKKWLELHPKLVERCPKVSFMSLLKVFSKKFA